MADFQETALNFLGDEGVYNLELANGTAVTGISTDTWESFAEAFESLRENPQPAGNIIVAPELITIAPYEIGDPYEALGVNVEERIANARDMSAAWPDSTLILGTPTTSPTGAKPKNSLLYVKAGEIIGQASKLPLLVGVETPYERATSAQVSQPLPDMSNVLPIISSDLLFHRLREDDKIAFLANGRPRPEDTYTDPITPQTDTLLVSACWQRPLLEKGKVRRDADYVTPLHAAAQALFRKYAALQDIVVIDRMPGITTPTSQPVAPINVHYRRVSS